MTLVDNFSLRAAVARFSATTNAVTYRDVLRECLQGDLLLDTTGSDIVMQEDGTTIASGSRLTFAGGTGPDGNKALFAFTRQEEAQKLHDGVAATTFGRPALSVVELVTQNESDWLFLDPAGPTCGIAAADLRRATRAPMNPTVKGALGIPDRVAQKTAVLAALAQGGVLLQAVRTDEAGQTQVRTTQGVDGGSYLLAFTSELEIVARFDTFEFVATPVEEIVDSVTSGEYAGLVLNPGGPWIALGAEELPSVQPAPK